MTTTSPTRRNVMIGASAAILVAVPAPRALAHRLARTETDVRFKADGSVSVIHAYHVQDVQDALFAAQIIDRPDISSLRHRAKLALYTADHFALKIDGKPVALDIIGAEVAGATVYVYQEALAAPRGTISIKATMLRELVSDQRNSVNVEIDGVVKTLDFKRDDGMKTLS